MKPVGKERLGDWHISDPVLTSREQSVLQSAVEFVQAHVSPNADRWELERHVPEPVLKQAAAAFAGLLVPSDVGGLGLPVATAATLLGELARGDLAFAFSLVVHINLTNTVARYGTEAQRARYLPGLLSGETFGAFCLTEPGAGSDVAGIQTEAHSEPGGWHLTGEKAWVSNAVFANLLSVYVRLPGSDPVSRRAANAYQDIGCFLVPAERQGILRVPAYELLGSHILGTAGLRFEDCPVTEEDLLFPAGEGFKAALGGIDLARVLLSAMCCAVLAQALDVAREYARRRQAFGRSTLDFQGLQWQLAEIATHLEAARLLTSKAADRLDRGESATLAAAHAKKYATRAAFDGVSAAMQVMGAAGLKRDCPLPRQLANARTAQILDGTSEIQNIVISRHL